MNAPEKITITSDDLSTVRNPEPPPSPIMPEGEPPGLSAARFWPWVAGAVGILFLVLLVIGVGIALREPRQTSREADSGPSQSSPVKELTVEQWIAAERPKWSADITSSEQMKKHIESIHPLTTYKSAIISEMHASTVDGSSRAGVDGRNISEVDLLITFYWEGPITKDGFTEIRMRCDLQGKQIKSTRYERSNAAINMDTINWFEVGFALGPVLFGI